MGELSWSPSQLSVAEDAAMPAESEVMAAIARDLSSDESEVRTSALEVAALWIRRSEGPIGTGFAQQLLLNAIDSLRDPCAHLRERALSVVRELASCETAHVSNALETVIRRLLMCYEKNEGSVMYGAAKTMSFLATRLAPMRFVSVIVPIMKQEMSSQNAKPLCQAIRLLGAAIERMPCADMLSCIDDFVDQVKEAMGYNGAPEVRRAAVMCFVSIESVLGDNVRPYMDSLSHAQSKLVTIYVTRRRSKEQTK